MYILWTRSSPSVTLTSQCFWFSFHSHTVKNEIIREWWPYSESDFNSERSFLVMWIPPSIIFCFLWNIFTHPRPNFNGSLIESPLWRHGQVLITVIRGCNYLSRIFIEYCQFRNYNLLAYKLYKHKYKDNSLLSNRWLTIILSISPTN